MAEEFGIKFSIARGDSVLRVSEFDDAFGREFHLCVALKRALPFLTPCVILTFEELTA
jgi:hypothetical protein